jgi:hypothetical protein
VTLTLKIATHAYARLLTRLIGFKIPSDDGLSVTLDDRHFVTAQDCFHPAQ